MKRILGIRAEPRALNWAMVEGSRQRPIKIAAGTEIAPGPYDEGEVLHWIRNKTIFIVDHYQAQAMAVRYPEPKALGHNKDAARSRCRVEGVAIEAAISRGLPVSTATLNTISKNAGAPAKELLAGENLRNIDWSEHKEYVKEAILIAYSILDGNS